MANKFHFGSFTEEINATNSYTYFNHGDYGAYEITGLRIINDSSNERIYTLWISTGWEVDANLGNGTPLNNNSIAWGARSYAQAYCEGKSSVVLIDRLTPVWLWNFKSEANQNASGTTQHIHLRIFTTTIAGTTPGTNMESFMNVQYRYYRQNVTANSDTTTGAFGLLGTAD